MPRSSVRLVALFEDDAHERFLRRLTKRLGLRELRFVRCGDCTAVLRAFADEVQVLRSKRHQANLGLLALVDADDPQTAPRRDELDRIVREHGGARLDTDRIAYVVPARAIETWYVHLAVPEERPVDPVLDYKQTPAWRELAKDMGDAARRAVEAWDSAPEADPASLAQARGELERLR